MEQLRAFGQVNDDVQAALADLAERLAAPQAAALASSIEQFLARLPALLEVGDKLHGEIERIVP